MPDKLPVTTDLFWLSQMNCELVEFLPTLCQPSDSYWPIPYSQEPVFAFRKQPAGVNSDELAEIAAKVEELFRA